MKKYDFLIVGSGLFGSVFARQAMDVGKSCLVVEKRSHTGGNLFCEDIGGIHVHVYGAHIFHTNNQMVWDYVNRFVEWNRYTNSPLANYKGEIYNLPFNMNTFYRMWGVITPQEAHDKIARQCAAIPEEPRNLEEQAIRLVGTDIYQKLIKGYTEKQWGRPCDQLPPFIIRRLPVRYTYDNNYFNDRYQGIPIGGYNRLIDRLLDGADVETGVDYNAQRAKYEKLAERIVYTGTLDSYFHTCYGPLEYRSLRFESEQLDIPNYQGNAVVNYTDSETPYTRIIEHKHFEFGTQPTTVITKEYPETWMAGMEPYYPINDEKNARIYERYVSLMADEKKVIFGGRLAEYRYYDMDKVIESALNKAAQALREYL